VATGVLCNNKRSLYFSLFILFLYILVNLFVGQRALLFVWVLICLWMYNLITKRDLPFFKISLLGISLMIFAQFLESFRGGRSDFG
ncbi:O-antigen polysaccharide polymerase Wzy, partial [Acinetobacter baumannii]